MVKWDYEDDEEESQTNWQQNSLVLICAVMIVGLGWLFASNRLPTGNKKPVSPSGRMFVVPAAKKRGWRDYVRVRSPSHTPEQFLSADSSPTFEYSPQDDFRKVIIPGLVRVGRGLGRAGRGLGRAGRWVFDHARNPLNLHPSSSR